MHPPQTQPIPAQDEVSSLCDINTAINTTDETNQPNHRSPLRSAARTRRNRPFIPLPTPIHRTIPPSPPPPQALGRRPPPRSRALPNPTRGKQGSKERDRERERRGDTHLGAAVATSRSPGSGAAAAAARRGARVRAELICLSLLASPPALVFLSLALTSPRPRRCLRPLSLPLSPCVFFSLSFPFFPPFLPCIFFPLLTERDGLRRGQERRVGPTGRDPHGSHAQ